MNIVHLLWDSVFPYRCPGCSREVAKGLCEACRGRLLPIVDASCPFCPLKTPHGRTCLECRGVTSLDGATVLLRFESPLREAIHRTKYGSDRRLGGWLGAQLRTPPLPADLVTAVPLHRTRVWSRGFNQSEILAKGLAAHIELPYSPILSRTRATQSQTGFDRAGRQANVKNAFKASVKQNLTGKIVLIVDDVLTTGSTLDACAYELKQSGAAHVWAIVLARHI